MLLASTAIARTLSSAAQWNNADSGYASYTFSGQNISATNSQWIRTLHQFAGDFDMEFTYQAVANGTEMLFYPVASDGSFVSSTGSADAGLGALSGMFGFKWTAATTMSMQAAASAEATTTVNPGDTVRVYRVGSTVSVYVNGVLVRTMTATSTGTVRWAAGSFGNNVDFRTISWSGGA